ncbi:hypothetical protein COY32_03545 [candidate division WWE3 bacterium CG_4_10_14_0_2_um_filter_41_14]|uniref:GIY-YIG domain-containing protein n=1 Tax=candidate division WWE3 bacterium CG_4_10_14_0_2_um_filter_41_14 TaxID=1975072 RepID=A0A2M7TIR8_UNCKA|nr:MAG: hypothetical protein COY32_03545 [candidate division WWE3 bacterium CG_4_10_14_0_2_um_filter_41_14]
MYFLYILQNPKGIYYIGVSNDVSRRLREHNSGRGAKITAQRGGFSIVYTEEYQNINVAYAREKQLKGWSRAKKKALVLGNIDELKLLRKSR